MIKIIQTLAISFLCLVANANIVFQGNTYAGGGGGAISDPSTNAFSYDSYSGLGGNETFLRIDQYWYRITTGIGITNSANHYVLARTVDPFCSENPPASAQWYVYPSNPLYSGVQWQNYPNGTPPSATNLYSAVTYNISGQVGVINYSTSTVMPYFIDLASQPTSTITGISPSTGRIYYNQCENTVDVGIGNSWSSLWPNTKNYFLQKKQAFEFGNSQTRIVGEFGTGLYGTGFSNIVQLNFVTDNKKSLVLGRDFYKHNSDLNFSGSVGSVPNFQFGNYTLTDTDHLVVLHNSAAASTFTLPNNSFPISEQGRHYIIINSSSNNLTLSPSVNGLVSSIVPPNESVMIVNVGSWYRIN
ncbi:hypothetical protein SAMN06298216_2639 [Spirosomataceae bacterium TFI 002]|nr:hypothetical protein SAMN06298216_2639 [Spirosomataceae bacterium TFI 002]